MVLIATHRWIGKRSSQTRFVLKYLLGYPNVRNDDGSWTERGNLVRTPIEDGLPAAIHAALGIVQELEDGRMWEAL